MDRSKKDDDSTALYTLAVFLPVMIGQSTGILSNDGNSVS